MIGAIRDVGIDLLASTVSKTRVPVAERCASLMSPKKAERMVRGTGVEKISIADSDVFASDLCFASANRLLDCGAKREEIGAIIFVSQTPDYTIPATSFYLQDRLGLPTDVLAFDVTQGCAGFTYGLYIAASLLSNLDKNVLLCCGDTASRKAYPGDTSLYSLLGDAGSAAIIRRYPKQSGKDIYFNIESFGNRAATLHRDRGGARAPWITDADGHITGDRSNYTVMDGMGIMDFSLHETPANIEALLQYANISKDQLDIAVVHQAQKMIVESLADKLGLPREKVPFKSGHIGNTDMATIPVCLTELKKGGEYRPWKTALLSGFGVGLSVASMIVDLSDTVVLETGEI